VLSRDQAGGQGKLCKRNLAYALSALTHFSACLLLARGFCVLREVAGRQAPVAGQKHMKLGLCTQRLPLRPDFRCTMQPWAATAFKNCNRIQKTATAFRKLKLHQKTFCCTMQPWAATAFRKLRVRTPMSWSCYTRSCSLAMQGPCTHELLLLLLLLLLLHPHLRLPLKTLGFPHLLSSASCLLSFSLLFLFFCQKEVSQRPQHML